jgi:hypothetical protein
LLESTALSMPYSPGPCPYQICKATLVILLTLDGGLVSFA